MSLVSSYDPPAGQWRHYCSNPGYQAGTTPPGLGVPGTLTPGASGYQAGTTLTPEARGVGPVPPPSILSYLMSPIFLLIEASIFVLIFKYKLSV